MLFDTALSKSFLGDLHLRSDVSHLQEDRLTLGGSEMSLAPDVLRLAIFSQKLVHCLTYAGFSSCHL